MFKLIQSTITITLPSSIHKFMLFIKHKYQRDQEPLFCSRSNSSLANLANFSNFSNHSSLANLTSLKSNSSLKNLSKPLQSLSTFSGAVDYFKRNLSRLGSKPKPVVQAKDLETKKKPTNLCKLTVSLSPANQVQVQSQGPIFKTFQNKVCTTKATNPKRLTKVPLNKGVLANKVKFFTNPKEKVLVKLKTSRSGKVQTVSRMNNEGKRSYRKSIMISKETLCDDCESYMTVCGFNAYE